MADRRAQFIATYLPYAQEASAITGIDPGVILAQAAHESAWGRKAPGNNFFGIKGSGQSFATHEYIGGKRVNMKAGFRRYSDPRESFLDWARLMQKPRYAGVLAAKTPEEQIKALKAAGYATDPAYVRKLSNVRNQVASIAGPSLVTPAGRAGPDVSGIMDVASLNEAPPAVPSPPTASQGFAPSFLPPSPAAPAQDAITQMLASAPPTMPPQWASATGFPIDEALTGRSAQETLMGGPRMDPRRAGPATGFMPPDMGQMLTPADVLDAGPRLRPPIEVDMPLPPPRPTGPGIFQRNAVSGAPDASLVPTPPSRAMGIPDPRMRPRPESMVAGRPEFPGAMPGASPEPAAPSPYDDWTRAFDIPPPFSRMADNPLPERPNRTEYPSMVAGRPEFPGSLPMAGPNFDAANPAIQLPPQWSDATSFPPPPAPIGTVEAGSTGGEWFTPGGWPAPAPDPLASRFDDAFAPGGAGQIMDLQTAFDRRNAPPAMSAQDGINSVFGAPPVQAMLPNLAIPFSEVPGFDMGRFGGASPAEAATIASPLPRPEISMDDFNARFGGGSVVDAPPIPTPGFTPGVVQGEMPVPGAPMDIRPPVQGGPAFTPPIPQPPRQTNPGAERQRTSIAARVLGGLLGGPMGAIGAGLLGGGGGGFGGRPSFAWSGGGSAPYGNNGGSTTYQKGTSNALGGSNALSWTGSKGQTVTVVQDPTTGHYYTAF